MPVAFKLDHLQPIEQLLFPNFCNFFTFILGGQFLLQCRRARGRAPPGCPPPWSGPCTSLSVFRRCYEEKRMIKTKESAGGVSFYIRLRGHLGRPALPGR